MIPNIAAPTLVKARAVWKDMVSQYGRPVLLVSSDGISTLSIKAFAKRPKIMGLFDRTEQSYDQEKYILICDADDFVGANKPHKFMRANWDGQDHVFISVTEVDLLGTVFGYRILVKG